MALYAIGDIHGHRGVLEALVGMHEFAADDLVIFLGDYVDKGPDVAGTLEFLIDFSERISCIFLRGNHDQLLLDAIESDPKVDIWECLAGEHPLASYGEGSSKELLRKIPKSHVDFLKKSVLYHETENYIFVHAGIRGEKSPADEDPDRLLWSTLSIAYPHFSGKTVICGHSAQISGEILDLDHTICADTGISKEAWLTCLNLNDFSFRQVSLSLVQSMGRLR